MRPYALIDLHCDTLTDCMYAGSNIIDTLDDPRAHAVAHKYSEGHPLGAVFRRVRARELRGEKAHPLF